MTAAGTDKVMNPVGEAFLTGFVPKSRRERANFELGSESRRGRFLNRSAAEILACKARIISKSEVVF